MKFLEVVDIIAILVILGREVLETLGNISFKVMISYVIIA